MPQSSSLIPTTLTPAVVSGPLETQINSITSATDLFGDNCGGSSSLKVQSIVPNTRAQYYQQVQVQPQKPNDSTMNKTGDFSGHRPIIQSNMLPATYKITQVGPVIGSNVVVSKMENSIQTKPTGTNLIPTSGPLSNSNSNYYFKNNNNNNNNINSNSNSNNSSNNSNNSSTINQTKSNTNINRTVTPRGPSTSKSSAQNSNSSNTPNFYHTTANNVTKFTNMIVGNVSAKNPLKPNHFTLPNNTNSSNNVGGHVSGSNNGNGNGNLLNLATHPNHNLTAPNTSGIAPKTTLRASDLIHILPNLFNTLKRRNSQSGNGANTHNTSTSTNNPGNGNGNGNNNNLLFNGTGHATASNSLAAAVAAAASNSGKPMSSSTAAALVAEQLLNVAASGSFSDDSSSPPPPNYYNNSNHHQHLHNYSAASKRFKLNPSALQCEICGKIYKHRNCLSKHMWEHHESWEHTKKVCQTKHQQVQLLEAAQVLAELISGVQSASMEHNKSAENFGEDDNSENEEEEDDDDGEVVDVQLFEEINSVNESVEFESMGNF